MIRPTVLLVVVMLVLSGCSGAGGAGDGGDTAAPTDAPAGESGSSGGSGGSDSSDDAGGSDGFEPIDDFEERGTERQMADYIDRSPFPVFRPGEYFLYEGTNTISGEDAVPVTMEIRSHEGGEWLDADIDVTVTRGEETLSFLQEDGTFGRVLFGAPEFTFTQTGRSFVWLYRLNALESVEPRLSELDVGDTWRYESPGEEDVPNGFTFEVTERRTYAGQECLVVVTTAFEGEETRPFSTACHATDVAMPLYYAQYGDDGAAMVELELVEYE
jgi:hypothetical protein